MKTNYLPRLASQIFNTPLAIDPVKMEAILHAVGPRFGLQLPEEEVGSGIFTLNGNPIPLNGSSISLPYSGSFGGVAGNPSTYPYFYIPQTVTFSQNQFAAGDPMERKGYSITSDGVACIPIQGTLMKKSRGLWAMSGCSSYESIQAMVQEALGDPECRGILLDIDSPGGSTHGLFELCDFLSSVDRRGKPVYAISNDAALSAAYAIASCADRLWVTRTGAVGSIGIFCLHVDQSKADEKAGIEYTYIFAGKKKVDGNPHEPLTKGAQADAQREVDRQYEMFVGTVARNRRLEAEDVRDTEAGCLYGDGAVPLLADKVGTYQDAMAALLKKIAGGNSQRKGMMNAMPAIAPHKTATVKKAWNGAAAKKNLKEGEKQGYYEQAFAFRRDDGDPETKAGYSFIHHEVSGSGDIGAANLTACSSGIAILNGGRGGGGRTSYTASEREGIYRHLAKHLKDGGEEPPELKSLAAIAAEKENEESIMAKRKFDDDPLAIDSKRAGSKADDEYMKDEKEDDEKASVSEKSEEEEEDDNKKRAKKKAAASVAAASKSDDDEEEEEEEEDDDEEEEDEEEDDKKKAARGRKASAVDPNAVQICNLCTLAGRPEMAAKFITRGLTVKQVQAKLLDMRSKASAESGSLGTSQGLGSVSTSELDKIESQARALAANSKTTVAQAYKTLLAQNPDIYTRYIEERDEVLNSNKSRKAYVQQLAQRFTQPAW